MDEKTKGQKRMGNYAGQHMIHWIAANVRKSITAKAGDDVLKKFMAKVRRRQQLINDHAHRVSHQHVP